jgi:hypothetical protein
VDLRPTSGLVPGPARWLRPAADGGPPIRAGVSGAEVIDGRQSGRGVGRAGRRPRSGGRIPPGSFTIGVKLAPRPISGGEHGLRQPRSTKPGAADAAGACQSSPAATAAIPPAMAPRATRARAPRAYGGRGARALGARRAGTIGHWHARRLPRLYADLADDRDVPAALARVLRGAGNRVRRRRSLSTAGPPSRSSAPTSLVSLERRLRVVLAQRAQ